MYVDFAFYSVNYGGGVSKEDFTKLEIQASLTIDFYTFNRIKEPDDKVKLAVCELIDYLKELENNGGKEISQESVSGHSVSYVTSENQLTSEARKRNIIKKYLGHTGLMYRGG